VVKSIFHFSGPSGLLKTILSSLISFLFLSACSGGPGEISFFGTASSGESGLLPCGPEGLVDPTAAGFLCEIITSAGNFEPKF